mgnify:CR=1 FL=1
MAKRILDLYANRCFASITMSAANVVTFQQIIFGVGTFQGIALVIHKIWWFPISTTIAEIVAAADKLFLALTARDDLTSLDPTNQAVYAAKQILPPGAPVEPVVTPLESNFCDLPSGGLIVPANPIYLAMSSAGFANPGTCKICMLYTFKELSDKENLEVLQTLLPGNV